MLLEKGCPPSLGNPISGVPPIRWLGLQTYCFFLNFQTKKQKLFYPSYPPETLADPSVSILPSGALPVFEAGAKVSLYLLLPNFLQSFFSSPLPC